MSEAPPPPAVLLEAERARAYCELAARLLAVSRPGSQFFEPAQLRHLLWGASHPWPRAPHARVEVVAATGWPSVRTLEQLSLLRSTAVDYFEAHRTRPSPEAKSFLTALAASALPRQATTVARLVSRARGGRRFQVVHERYAGHLGVPVRFTFHLTDERARYLEVRRDGQASISRALSKALELSCEGGAEEALWGLSALEGAEVAEVVMGQLGPLEAPGFFAAPSSPLRRFLAGQPPGGAVLHAVIERAAADVAQDGCRDPFFQPTGGGEAQRRRAALGYRVFRERRLACTGGIRAALEAQLASLGQRLVVRAGE